MSLFSGRRLTNPDPFCIVLLFFPAGETQIWPGDLRVLAVLPGFLVWCWICIELWIFSVQRLHGIRQVVTHVQSQQKDEL